MAADFDPSVREPGRRAREVSWGGVRDPEPRTFTLHIDPHSARFCAEGMIHVKQPVEGEGVEVRGER